MHFYSTSGAVLSFIRFADMSLIMKANDAAFIHGKY